MKKRLYGISILVFLVLLALSFTTGTDASSVPVEKCYQLIGHRGFSGDYPENTIESFVGAKDAGFNGVFCKPLLQKVAKQFCRLLHLHFVGNCIRLCRPDKTGRMPPQTLLIVTV